MAPDFIEKFIHIIQIMRIYPGISELDGDHQVIPVVVVGRIPIVSHHFCSLLTRPIRYRLVYPQDFIPLLRVNLVEAWEPLLERSLVVLIEYLIHIVNHHLEADHQMSMVVAEEEANVLAAGCMICDELIMQAFGFNEVPSLVIFSLIAQGPEGPHLVGFERRQYPKHFDAPEVPPSFFRLQDLDASADAHLCTVV